MSKTKRTYEELKGTEKEIYEICENDQRAVDNNTEWCIRYWLYKSIEEDSIVKTIRKYPPESLTKYRRNLISDGLITQSEKSKQHSVEQELKNHKPIYQHKAENDWNNCFKSVSHPLL